MSFNHTIDADYFFDPDGPAGPEAEILLVQDIRQTSWNDQLADIGEAAGQEWSGFLEVGSGLDLTAESQFRVTGTLAGGASPEALTSGVWRFTFAAGVPEGPFDLSSTDVQVQTDSTLRVSTVEGAVALGLLTLESGTLTNTGVDLSFTGGTSIDAAADAVVGVNLQSEIDLGQINVVNPTPVTFVKAGPLDLVMTAASVGAAGFGNVTFDVQEGRLIGVHGANPFDTAALQLGGGDLILSSAGGNVSYDNALSVTESATLTAGAAGGGVAEALTVTLGGTAGNGLAVDAGKTLTVQTTDGYSLDIAATVDGPQGNVRVEQGAVSFTGGGSVASLRIPDGASVGIDADRPVTIGQTLTLGTTSLQIDQANTFSVSSPDLLAGGDVTLSGGTLTIANSSAPPVIVVPPEALALTGGIELVEERGDFAPGNLAEGGTPFAGAPLAGTLHAIEGLNDLTYGNGFSWIGDAGAAPIAGISLGASPISVGSIAFGRDNADSHANGGPFQYRWAGLYTLQYTQVPNPNETTSDESWTNIGTLDYIADDGEGFAEPMVRHRYVFDPVEATGIRLVVPNVGMAVGTCIDEIELYGSTSGPIDLSGSHFDVTADTTLHFNTDLGAALGAVTLGPDVTLTATGATLTVVDVGAGHGATIVAEAMDVLGTISPGNDGIGTLTIGDGELGLAGSATYDAQVSLSTGEADLIEVSVGSLQLGGTLNVIGTGRTTSNSYDAKLSRRVVNNNFGAIGDAPSGTGFEFDEVIPPFGPGAAAHVGHGAFLRDVAYPKNASNITEGVDIELFVALGGDADGDGKVWLSDWAALRANFG
ncbi:MAG: hypothetical protein HQ567_09655, partial [Candidatus Nealsonbacteria bacterium]|nr:hypothetical protein [Candidatus Nealsonbacteria bacterium]